MSCLLDAPSSLLDARGRPRTGTYRGYGRDTDLTNDEVEGERQAPAGHQLLREKRWQRFTAAGPEVACGGTLFDAGYATTVFAWVFDRGAGRMLADHADILPPFMADIGDDPASGTIASLRGFERTFDFSRESGLAMLEMAVASIDLELNFELETLAPVTAIGTARDESGGLGMTQKETGLPVRGRLDVESRSFTLGAGSHAWDMLDDTHGLLPREAQWTWGMAGGTLEDGTSVGFNLSEDWNETRENVVWLGDEIHTLDDVHVECSPERPGRPWHLCSEDGSIDLTLSVEGLRRHETNFHVVASQYLQPLGYWHGRLIDREAHDLFGVAEDHEARW